MKIAQIVPRMESGGVERGTLEVARALTDASHQAVVVSEGGAMVEELIDGGARHIALGVARKSPRSLLNVRPLAELMSQERFDVVHCRSRLPAWLTVLALRTMSEPKPHLVTSIHGLYSVSRYSAVMAKGELIEVVSNSAKDYLLQNYPGVDSSKIRVIHRGIDPLVYNSSVRPSAQWMELWEKETDNARATSEPVLTLAGRLSPLKGHNAFLSTLETLSAKGRPHIGLIVGGEEGRHRKYLTMLKRRVVESDHLRDRVFFVGHRPDIAQIFSISDFVLSLSMQPESFGRTVLESLSLGTPVVGFDHGGVGEILEAIYPAGRVSTMNPEDVASRIIELENAPQPIGKHSMTLERMCDSTISMYQELAG